MDASRPQRCSRPSSSSCWLDAILPAWCTSAAAAPPPQCGHAHCRPCANSLVCRKLERGSSQPPGRPSGGVSARRCRVRQLALNRHAPRVCRVHLWPRPERPVITVDRRKGQWRALDQCQPAAARPSLSFGVPAFGEMADAHVRNRNVDAALATRIRASYHHRKIPAALFL